MVEISPAPHSSVIYKASAKRVCVLKVEFQFADHLKLNSSIAVTALRGDCARDLFKIVQIECLATRKASSEFRGLVMSCWDRARA